MVEHHSTDSREEAGDRVELALRVKRVGGGHINYSGGQGTTNYYSRRADTACHSVATLMALKAPRQFGPPVDPLEERAS